MQDFRKLHVWRKAHGLVLNVRRATNSFPVNGYSELKKQITRSSESVSTNIVEGCGAFSQKDFSRFLQISIKSAAELEYQLMLARDYGILKRAQWQAVTDDTIEVRRMLCGLRKKVEADCGHPSR
jgi:four helix bundle protein